MKISIFYNVIFLSLHIQQYKSRKAKFRQSGNDATQFRKCGTMKN